MFDWDLPLKKSSNFVFSYGPLVSVDDLIRIEEELKKKEGYYYGKI